MRHLIMVEEAHRLLRRVSETSEGANPRAKAVEFFCNMLAEIRSVGQGFLIADQIPTKLASDTVKNTNLKIVHRIVDREDREAIGKAMNMSEDQISFLACLKRGYAAVYSEGDNRPKLVHMPLVQAVTYMNREEVLQKTRNNVAEIAAQYTLRYDYNVGCSYCEQPCIWRSLVLQLPAFNDDVLLRKIVEFAANAHYDLPHLAGAITALLKPDKPHSLDHKICVLGFFLERTNLSEAAKAKAMARYLREWRH